MSEFVKSFKDMQEKVYALAYKNGFWEDVDEFTDCILNSGFSVDRIEGMLKTFNALKASQKICLMHSELSEALEGDRKGDPADDKIPEFTSIEAELADCVIRIMDFARANGLRVAEAIEAKHDFNCTRSYKHGKKY